MNNVSAASEQQISAGKNITQHIADLKSAARHTVTGIQSIADVTNNLHQFSSQLEQQMKKFHF